MENSKIQWTDNTWNVAVGCNKVSEGCKYCYMMRDMGGVHKMDVDGTVTRTSRKTFEKPLKWQGQAKAEGRNIKVFTSSLTDFFHEKIDEYRNDAWEIIRRCPDLIFQILTKRPERIEQCLPDDWLDHAGQINYKNVWLGATVENQKRANERIPLLLRIPAAIHFLSIEPILGPINLQSTKINPFCIKTHGSNWISYDFPMQNKIDWVIIGGESGNESGDWKYRPAKLEWFNDIIEQCHKNNVPVFVKQLGTRLAKTHKVDRKDRHGLNIENAFPAFKNNVFGLPIDDILRQFPRLTKGGG